MLALWEFCTILLFIVFLHCADINECDTIANTTCDKNAMCNNTVGSFECRCGSGFVGDGYSCARVTRELICVNLCLP